MSGAHDVARDAAADLVRYLEEDPTIALFQVQDEIETIAKYLGVETERPRVVRHSNSQIAGQHVCDVNCREEEPR